MYEDEESVPSGMSDAELIAITDRQIAQALDYMGGQLAEDRRRNLSYYMAEATGDLSPPAISGRSSVVSTDVADTVEWMLPGLVKTFAGGDEVVQFTPRRQQDVQSAQHATEYVNYVLQKQNPGFHIVQTWIKDALIQRVGIVKVWWDDSTEDAREVYRGLSDQALQILLMSPGIVPIEHATRPDDNEAQIAQNLAAMGLPAPPVSMVHDVTVRRTSKCNQVRIENVPPEEFLIDRFAKSIQTAAFTAHRVRRTISDLRAAGYTNVDDIAGDDFEDLGIERLQRNGQYAWEEDDPADESQRAVWITECYLRLDYNGDGIAEWRQVVRCGGVVLRNVECDGPPFVALSSIPLPHRFFGLCPADQAIESQKLKTSLMRAALDGLYHSINGRTYAVENQVNLDDLLTSRPGGVVRIKSQGAVGPLMEGRADLGAAQALLEYAEVQKENRTGFTRYSQGTNADALNQTAQGMNIITNRADGRMELIARNMAETGFVDLFRRIIQLISQYQDKVSWSRVNGEWVEIDPRGWKTQFDFTVQAGLGSNNKDQQVAHMMTLIALQKEALAIGLATPRELYNSAKQLCAALGYKQAETFFVDPARAQPMPPKPSPEEIKAQAQMQMEQAKIQAQAQLEQFKAQMQQQTELAAQQAQQIQAEAQARVEAELADKKAQLEALRYASEEDFNRWKAELEAQTRIQVALINQSASAEPPENDSEDDGQPRAITMRLPDGKAVHVESHRVQALGEQPSRKLVMSLPDGRRVEVDPAKPQPMADD